MPYLKTSGATLYHECHGDGPPLMLIAGIASDSQSWLPVAETLSHDFTLILPDNRGAGRTRTEEEALSIDAMADDCAALIAHLGHERVHVVGHSMGGAIAQSLAIRYPQHVDHLVLAATGAKMSMRNRVLFDDLNALRQSGVDMLLWYKMLFQWLFRPAFFEDERAVSGAAEQALAYPHAQTSGNFSHQLAAAMAVDHHDDLGRITAPTLVLTAAQDLLFHHQDAQALVDAIADARLQVIDNAAHSLHWDNPQEFCAALRGFLLQRM